MVIITSCYFNPRPPTTTPPLPSTRPMKESSWRNQCVIGMACVIIGLQVEGIIGNDHDYVVAADLKAVVKSKGKGKRWSDKRMCQAWRLNSLETVVPEDLPRPSFKRKWESVGDYSQVAPSIKASTISGGCFSM